MLALIITVLVSTGISALCSTTEAMLYSVQWTHIEQLRERGSRAGELLFQMRSNIEQPITAVLTLNTVANTAGASIAGALAAAALGEANMPFFAAAFTVLILICGEILPKTLGVAYAAPLSGILVYYLRALIFVLKPITWTGGMITRLITPKKKGRKPRKTISAYWRACPGSPASFSLMRKRPYAISSLWIRSAFTMS